MMSYSMTLKKIAGIRPGLMRREEATMVLEYRGHINNSSLFQIVTLS